MSQLIKQEDGTEIEVYTAEEVAAAKAEVEGIYKPQLTEKETELLNARKTLSERAGEFAQFRKLNEDQKAQLSEKDRIIYENQELLEAARQRETQNNKNAHDGAIDLAIRSKVGTDQKVFDKVRGMYNVINVDDVTPEQIASRVNAAIGALGQTEPDLLATIGFSSGSYEPPKQNLDTQNTFADSERGRQGAAELGLLVEPPKK